MGSNVEELGSSSFTISDTLFCSPLRGTPQVSLECQKGSLASASNFQTSTMGMERAPLPTDAARAILVARAGQLARRPSSNATDLPLQERSDSKIKHRCAQQRESCSFGGLSLSLSTEPNVHSRNSEEVNIRLNGKTKPTRLSVEIFSTRTATTRPGNGAIILPLTSGTPASSYNLGRILLEAIATLLVCSFVY
ncbi:LADA_0H11606g1_1 [Lachancea dasiensis]|uniref:LADA_0H11606g1_1 n=1 Tax=Lachancea dasiensis TaxID=1072105 RepID=A0A1G4K3G4_9SACH|nr:LADA_0H11606g1_1 [Lachancea dasiensis]